MIVPQVSVLICARPSRACLADDTRVTMPQLYRFASQNWAKRSRGKHISNIELQDGPMSAWRVRNERSQPTHPQACLRDSYLEIHGLTLAGRLCMSRIMRQIYLRGAGFGRCFVIADQPPSLDQPNQRALHDPPLGENVEPTDALQASDYLQYAVAVGSPVNDTQIKRMLRASGVSAVRRDGLYVSPLDERLLVIPKFKN